MLGGLALAVGMLISGAFNTISNEFMDKVHAKGIANPSTFWNKEEDSEAEGTSAAFNHPFVQAEFMFLGEAICLLIFLISNRTARWKNQHGWKAIFCYACTAACDMTATSIMYAGLALSSASIYQMLRGAIVVFTALLSVIWLRKQLCMFHWAGVWTVVMGVCIVGAQSIMQEGASGNGSRSAMVLGILLILAAQAVQSVQVVAQEKFIRRFGTPDLLLVGLEGVFGATMLGLLLLPMYFVKVEGYPIENAPDAWAQIKNSPSELPTGRPNWHLPVGNALVVAIAGNICSIAFFNVFGIKITTVLSGSHRMILDSMRTCLVWTAALVLGWETFHVIQLVGFVVMLVGIALYNEILRIPVLFKYPARQVQVANHGLPVKNEDQNLLDAREAAATGGA